MRVEKIFVYILLTVRVNIVRLMLVIHRMYVEERVFSYTGTQSGQDKSKNLVK